MRTLPLSLSPSLLDKSLRWTSKDVVNTERTFLSGAQQNPGKSNAALEHALYLAATTDDLLRSSQ